MRTPKRWNVLILLFSLALPASSYAGSGGIKNLFHFHRGNSSVPQHQNIHPAVKHYAANHPKPLRAKNIHPSKSKRGKPS